MEQAWTARIASGSPQHTARAHQRALPCLDNVENSDITQVTTLVRGGRSRGGGTRTHGLLVPNQARYRLRYAPRYPGRTLARSQSIRARFEFNGRPGPSSDGSCVGAEPRWQLSQLRGACRMTPQHAVTVRGKVTQELRRRLSNIRRWGPLPPFDGLLLGSDRRVAPSLSLEPSCEFRSLFTERTVQTPTTPLGLRRERRRERFAELHLGSTAHQP
jgi:hypothetical protein